MMSLHCNWGNKVQMMPTLMLWFCNFSMWSTTSITPNMLDYILFITCLQIKANVMIYLTHKSKWSPCRVCLVSLIAWAFRKNTLILYNWKAFIVVRVFAAKWCSSSSGPQLWAASWSVTISIWKWFVLTNVFFVFLFSCWFNNPCSRCFFLCRTPATHDPQTTFILNSLSDHFCCQHWHSLTSISFLMTASIVLKVPPNTNIFFVHNNFVKFVYILLLHFIQTATCGNYTTIYATANGCMPCHYTNGNCRTVGTRIIKL